MKIMKSKPFNEVLVVFVVLLMASFLGFGPAYAQPELEWQTQLVDTGSQIRDVAVAVDSERNIVVAGSSLDTSTFVQSFLLLKFAPDGGDPFGDPIWEKVYQFGGNSTNVFLDVAVDSENNIIAVGVSDVVGYMAKFDSDGNLLWEIGSIGSEPIDSVGVDSSNEIYCSSRQGTVRYLYQTVEKYDSSGNPLWTWVSPDYIEQRSHIAIDSINNILVAVYFRTTTDGYIWKLNPDRTVRWEKSYVTDGWDAPAGIASDPYDNTVLITKSSGMVAKFDDAGNLLGENTGYQDAGGVAIDSTGGLIVVSNADPTDSEGLRGYDECLNQQWAVNDFANKGLEDIVFDSDNNIIVAGIADNSDVYLAKFSLGDAPDGDGILDSVDGYKGETTFVKESDIYSDNFSDQNVGGTSFGYIKDRSGLTVTVEDVPSPDGLRISASSCGSGGGSKAQIRICDISPPYGRVLLSDGDDIIVTCGSLTMNVLEGPVELLLLNNDAITVTAPTGAAISITEPANGQVEVQNSGSEAITIEENGEVITLNAGESQTFQSSLPPVADPNGPYLVAVDQSINFDGTGSSDPDGDPITYGWSVEAGSMDNSTLAGPIYTAPSEAGIYEVSLSVTDSSSLTDTASTLVVVYDPDGGFVTGGGWIDSPEGAYIADPSLIGKANFGFVAKYDKKTKLPKGNTEFVFEAGDLNFHSNDYQWLVVNQNGLNAQFKGKGTINDSGEYKFMLWAGDGEPDTFRIRIWEEDEETAEETDIYDNGTEQEIGGGSIVIHTKKK